MRVLRVVLGSVVGVVVLLACSAPAVFAAGDANEASCANEANTGFSSALPDCRAFELVSPVAKNGYQVTFYGLLDGGERVAGASIGVLAGATSDPDCPTSAYDLARTLGGWSASAVDDAPLEEFAYATAKCAKLLLGENGDRLMLLRPASGSAFERDLYVQRAGGKFEEVGPMLPPTIPASPSGPGQQAGDTTYVAATPDLSHVLFTLQPVTKSEQWPKDTTVLAPNNQFFNQALFEYAGAGNTEPVLVGVNNAGTASKAGALISDCGTSPGGGQQGGNRLNTISADGSRVFFTAIGAEDPATPECVGAAVLPPASELFARVDGVAPQSPTDAAGECTNVGDACTVAISEPGALAQAPANPDCTGACREDTTDEADFRSANYEGAAADGSKVFFTSTQRLLNGATQDDAAHEEEGEVTQDGAAPVNGRKGCVHTTPGAGGCNLYEYDFAEDPETGKPVGLVLISKAETGGGGVGGPRVQGVGAVCADGSHVYFVARGVLTQTPNAQGASAVDGGENLYVSDTTTGATSFIATLTPGDAQQGGDDEQWQYNAATPMNVSGDGRYLVFTSTAELTRDDSTHVAQVFRYDAVTRELTRVSAGEEGYNDDGDAPAAPAQVEHYGSESVEGIGAAGADLHPAVSEGGVVVFKSSDALTSTAFDNRCVSGEGGECFEYAQNVYEYREGHVYLISGGGEAPLGIFEGAASVSPSGRDIFFETRQALAPQDPDTVADVYDARVEGGFPAASSAPPCTGEGCEGPSGPPVSLQAPSSLAPATAVSPPAPALVGPTPKQALVKCAKGRRRSGGKCVKPRSRKRRSKRSKRGGRS